MPEKSKKNVSLIAPQTTEILHVPECTGLVILHSHSQAGRIGSGFTSQCRDSDLLAHPKLKHISQRFSTAVVLFIHCQENTKILIIHNL